MALRDESGASIAQLAANVLTDVRTLVRQELALARAELREELTRILALVAVLAVAAGALAVGGLWLLIAATRTIAEVFGWPLAAVYGAIGAALGVVGLVLLAVAWRQARRLQVLPKTRETLKTQVQWVSRRVGA
jgi:TRAP-type C4-dicarboxylate transport system permease small subunit